MSPIQKDKFKARGIYLLPNLLTISALFAGFYAIVAAMKGMFDNAAIAIFVAMLLDSFDGRVARLTNTQTAFGAELDSLSDMVSFGVGPALVMYNWTLFHLGKLGWLTAFIYAVAVALRLARFNTQLSMMDKRYFQGVPCPAPAGVLAGMVWVSTNLKLTGEWLSITAAIITILMGIFMISNIRYHSFKEIDIKNNVSFLSIVVLALILVLIAIDPPKLLFAIFFIYAMSGPILTLLGKHKKRRQIIAKRRHRAKKKQ